MEFVDYLDLFDEMGDVFVPKTSLFYVFFDSYLLTVQLTQKDLPIAAFPDRLDGFYLVLADQKSQLDPLLLQILRHLIYIKPKLL